MKRVVTGAQKNSKLVQFVVFTLGKVTVYTDQDKIWREKYTMGTPRSRTPNFTLMEVGGYANAKISKFGQNCGILAVFRLARAIICTDQIKILREMVYHRFSNTRQIGS